MGASPRFNVVSPIGRLVEGDPWKAQEKDGDGNVRVYKSGPNVGKPNPQYYVGLAVPKLIQGQPNQDWASFNAFVDQVARAAWPNLFPGGGQCIAQNFAWKIRDGDGFVRQGKNAGKPLADKPGFAGHWIISFASSFAPQCVVETSPGSFGEITDQSLLKTGYYARIGASISGNDSVQTPGLYLNLEKIELKGIGEVIQRGISAAEAFGGAVAGAVPEGMQALPPGFTSAVPAGFGGAPSGQAPNPPFGGPGGPASPGPGPGPGAPPAAQWQGQAPTPAPTPAFTPPVASMHVMLPAAQGATYEQCIALGWTDATMIAQGLMQAPLAPPPTGAPGPGMGGPGSPAVPPQPAFAGPAGPGPGLPATGGFASPVISPTISPSNPAPLAPPASGFMGVRVMLPAAQGATYEQCIALGWTDATLIQHGMMAAQ